MLPVYNNNHNGNNNNSNNGNNNKHNQNKRNFKYNDKHNNSNNNNDIKRNNNKHNTKHTVKQHQRQQTQQETEHQTRQQQLSKNNNNNKNRQNSDKTFAYEELQWFRTPAIFPHSYPFENWSAKDYQNIAEMIAEQKHEGSVHQNLHRKPLFMEAWKVKDRLFGITLRWEIFF